MSNCRLLFLGVLLIGAAVAQPDRVKRIDLVSLTHLDVGYTDNPAVVREIQRRYIDVGIDAVLRSANGPEGARFTWTAESLLSIDDWWRAATPERRQDLLRAIDSGRFEVAALPMNMAPFMGPT